MFFARPAPRALLVLNVLLAAAGCSRGGELQADVAAHCAELQRNVEQMAKAYREGGNRFPLLGGELNGDLLTRLYSEVSWCAKVRSADPKALLALTQELSVLLSDVDAQAPLAARGKALADAWVAPEASAARVEVATKLDRVAAILREINQRPLKR
jgi:hypothetical protein